MANGYVGTQIFFANKTTLCRANCVHATITSIHRDGEGVIHLTLECEGLEFGYNSKTNGKKEERGVYALLNLLAERHGVTEIVYLNNLKVVTSQNFNRLRYFTCLREFVLKIKGGNSPEGVICFCVVFAVWLTFLSLYDSV
jgi:hypothetical protein